MDVDRVDLSLICRTCRCVSPNMKSVFGGVEHPQQNPRIDEMLMACAAVQVAFHDGLPSLMCEHCVQTLKNSFIFKKQAEAVDSSLREYTKNVKVHAIKQELQNTEFIESLHTLSNLLTQNPQSESQPGPAGSNDVSKLYPILQSTEQATSSIIKKTPLPPETDYIQILDNNQMLLTCRECAKIFTTLEGLKCHKRLHAGETYKCKHCDKSYTRLNHLHRHEASHGKRKVHVCKVCNKTLTRMEHLKRHLVTHLREKPFNCKSCNRGFNRIEHLHNHLPKCKGDSAFICDICNKAFNREDSLEVHKQQHGRGGPLPTLENLDNIEEHYYEVDFDPTVNFSDHSDLEDSCFEPQVEVVTEEQETKPKIQKLQQNQEQGQGDEVTVETDIATREDDFMDNDDMESIGGDENEMLTVAREEVLEGIDEKEEKESKADIEDIIKSEERIEYSHEGVLENVEIYTAEEKAEIIRKAKRDLNLENDDVGDVHVSDAASSDSEYIPLKKLIQKQSKKDRMKARKDRMDKKGRRGRPRIHPPKQPKIPGRRGRPPGTRIKKKEDEIGEFPCPACDQMFDRLSLLDKHCKVEHPGQKIHQCLICRKSFHRANHLNRHLMAHSDIRPFQCRFCPKSFNRRDHMIIHERLHDRCFDFVCDICEKTFHRKDHLVRHKANKHNAGDKIVSEKKYNCEICNKGFTTEKYRDVHMKGHTGEKTFTCKVCEKSFLSKSHLTEHMKFHNEHSKKFLCSECGQRFIRNDYLVIHMRRHRGEKPFKCKFCGKGFPRTTDLTVHERYHTGEKTHLCTTCGRGFGRAYNLTVHMRTHTGEKPYQCTYCDAAFAQGNDLKAHVRRHTGERFQCDLCSESFLMGYLLTQHKRAVHGLNVVSNIRRLQPVHKVENSDDPPPITIPLPKPVVPDNLMFNHMQASMQAQLAIAQMHAFARD